MSHVLSQHGYNVDLNHLKRNHKLVSELIVFPDKTNKEFYKIFNQKLLISLGIIPANNILDELFNACSYLPWAPFQDTIALRNLNLDLGIISNFNSTLNQKLNELVPVKFSNVIVSENHRVRKPQLEFYRVALDEIDLLPSEILYIGDSIELDILPANEIGVNTLLVDRDEIYPYSSNKIKSLYEIKSKIIIFENEKG